MNVKKLLVTGSSGLIGSEVVAYFAANGWEVHGVDNNMRADFFGPQGDTRWNLAPARGDVVQLSATTRWTSATATR
jgi:CDP-paratose 2-epimerase